MCGFTGVWDPRLSLRHAADDVIRSMNACLVHRGPDDGDHWSDPERGIALGFRRLAIVDLSPQGRQPMTSHDGRFVITFNGEIYNHRDLRSQLAQCGISEWRGHSDTEVLLEGIAHWGVLATLQKAIGMFALAVWDRQEKTLSLARDRAGEKPLYFGRVGPVFAFASELNPFRRVPGWRGEINRAALEQFFRFRYVPAPDSIYKGIGKVAPGTYVTVSARPDGAFATQETTYWSAASAMHDALADPFTGTREAAADALEHLLGDAVELQLAADVPLGAFLSGGIDSSTIVALMQQRARGRVRTFSIGFRDASFDEAPQARAVAEHLGTDHTELYVEAQDAIDLIPSLPRIYDEPFSDSSQVPTALLSRLTRRHVTVALSGDAGDELFAGYNRYVWAPRLWSKLRYAPRATRRAAAALMRSLPTARWDAVFAMGGGRLSSMLEVRRPGEKLHKLAKVLDVGSTLDIYDRLVVDHSPHGAVMLHPPERSATESLQSSGDTGDVTKAMMLRDFTSYLSGDILTKVDRASMAASLETRAPFLDTRVIEFAWRLPVALNVEAGHGKEVVRSVLRRHVPQHLFDRPKQGFGIPLGQWLRGEIKPWAESLLDPSRIRDEGYLDPRTVSALWADHLSGRSEHEHLLWSVIMFQAWLAEYR